MVRRIIEGIHEVELEITPEFQKPTGPAKGGAWSEPETTTWNMIPRIDYKWPGFAAVLGVEMPGSVYAISWPRSTVVKGNWGSAIRAILRKDPWNRIYVYGVPEEHMAEFNDLVYEGVVRAAFYPGNVDASEYDFNAVYLLGEHLAHDEPQPLEGSGSEYPVVDKSLALADMIGNRPWASHEGDVISTASPLQITTAAVSPDAALAAKTLLTSSGLTVEYAPGAFMFYVWASPDMSQAEAHKELTSVLLKLDEFLGGPG